MKNVVLHSEARAELDEAIGFYEERRAGLGLDFLNEVAKILERIEENPKQGTLYRKTGHRKLVLRRFPYVVFYIELPDRIRVTAIAHGKRRPGYWRRRQDESEGGA